jgi:UDP-N-acetylmuramate--alanine ligase
MKYSTQPLHLHFIGIGGIGMSGIAEVFCNQGYSVSGSDLTENETTRRLGTLGIRIDLGHRKENVEGASVVVYSSAVQASNPELVEAKRLSIPVIPRAEALGELMRGKIGIAIAGTHGKTTTTTLMATVLASAGLDPTIVVGGKVDALGGNARLGQGDYLVAEADESDGSFLHLPAVYGVITNIDEDHLDHYGTLEKIDEAFSAFVARIPFFGKVMVCGDDPGIRRNLPGFKKPYETYGLERHNQLQATHLVESVNGVLFQVLDLNSGVLGEISLSAHGHHNIRNALAVIGIARTLGIDFDKIKKGLAQFKGVRRRFDLRYEDSARDIRILDDYGHHPTEILATLEAAHSYSSALRMDKKPGRVILAFQPHRYTRTKHSAEAFAECFGKADVLYLTEIYGAGEAPIPGVDGHFLASKVRSSKNSPKEVHFLGDLESCAEDIARNIQDGDLVLCMGAGSITSLPSLVLKALNV